MNSGHCSGEHTVEEEEGRLSLNDLPDELLIQIFNRLLDLKCLCFCSLVSPRFSSLVFQLHSVHFSVPDRTSTNDLIPTPANPADDSFVKKTLRFFVNGIVAKPLQYFHDFKTIRSMIFTIQFLNKFKSLRSLHLLHHSSSPTHPLNPNDDDDSICKWAAKLGPTITTLAFLCASSISVEGEVDFDQLEQEEDPMWLHESMKRRALLAMDCLQDAIVSHHVLRGFVRLTENPLLENITITYSKMQGSLCLRGSKIVEMRNWLKSSSVTELRRIEVPVNIHHLHLPVLKLPVSSKVMVSPTLVLLEMVDRRLEVMDWGVDAATVASLFSEQGEEEFAEAIAEMMVNHNSMMQIII